MHRNDFVTFCHCFQSSLCWMCLEGARARGACLSQIQSFMWRPCLEVSLAAWLRKRPQWANVWISCSQDCAETPLSNHLRCFTTLFPAFCRFALYDWSETDTCIQFGLSCSFSYSLNNTDSRSAITKLMASLVLSKTRHREVSCI